MIPNGFEIKHLGIEDLSILKSLVDVFNTVFQEDKLINGSDGYLLKLLANKNFIALTVISGNEVVGGLTAYELPMIYSDRSEIFIYDMVVKPEYQRIGIGKALIQKLKEYCVENNIQTFFVMAHEEDEHAVEFYKSTGGKSENVVNFLYEIK